MLKSSKLSHKLHKSKDSALRKDHLLKKSLRSGSPMRISGSSRSSAAMKHIPPGLQRGGHPGLKRKASNSPRLRSIALSPHRSLPRRKPESSVAMERIHSMKSLKYEKRKHLSNSPVPRHLSPSSLRRPMVPMHPHSMDPYPEGKYPSSSSAMPPYGNPTRKKMKREPEDFYGHDGMQSSPPHRRSIPPVHPGDHISRREAPPRMLEKHRHSPPPVPREKHMYDERSKRIMSPPDIPRSHSKDPSMRPYSTENSSRYISSDYSKNYPPEAQKSFGTTLHERFSSVVESNRYESRPKYSREDLEKITIDIKGNIRDSSPTLRRIINPAEVKLVRRPNEGRRPIFDRDEIKQAPRDLREDAYYERKKMSGAYSSSHGIDLREVENYQITRHRFDNHHDLFSSGSGRTLNDRWQNPVGRKEIPDLDRINNSREKDFPRASGSYVDPRSRSRSRDRDFRSERYIDTKPSQSRAEYAHRPPNAIPPTRTSVPYPPHKSNVPVDARNKLAVRKNIPHSSSIRAQAKSFSPHSDRRYAESMPSRIERRDHSPVPEPPKWSYKSRSPSRDKSEFNRRPEKSSFAKPWSDRPSGPPKGSNFYEHEKRESSSSYRGGSRPFRSPRGSFRGRGFRGSVRGSSFRGSFRGFGSSGSSRGFGSSSSSRGFGSSSNSRGFGGSSSSRGYGISSSSRGYGSSSSTRGYGSSSSSRGRGMTRR